MAIIWSSSNPGPGQDYAHLLAEVKERVRSAQYEALKAVNTELVGLYWDIGRMIVERQAGATWGKSIVQQLAGDSKTRTTGARNRLEPQHRHSKLTLRNPCMIHLNDAC